MRIIEQIPHPSFKMTLFSTEQYFILQFEAGPMQQAYKFSKDQFPSPTDLKSKLNDVFLDEVHDLFNQMFLNRKTLLDG